MKQTVPSSLQNYLLKMYDNSSEAIFFFNVVGNLVYLNNAAKQIVDIEVIEKMFLGEANAICLTCHGYTSEDALVTCKSCYFHEESRDFSSFQLFLNTKNEGVVPYAASFQTIDEQYGIKMLMLRPLTKQMETQNKLLENTTVKKVIKAQEDERKRISRELHDSVAQEVLSSLLEIQLVKYLPNEEAIHEKLQQIEGSLSRLLDDISNMSVELRPASLDDLGIEAAFRSHFSWIEKNYGLEIHYTSEINGQRYNSEIETVIYRVGQEAILNALKYADVDEIFVHLYEADDNVMLHIIDQGNGFNLANYNAKGTGLGLFGMKERTALVNGIIQIDTEIGKGTKVVLSVPIEGGI